MLDLDQAVKVRLNNAEVKSVKVVRTIAMMDQSLRERADPSVVFSAEIDLTKN